MARRPDADRPGAKLARSYLAVRADQVAERQPTDLPSPVQGSVTLPRLDRVRLDSPETMAQRRVADLARLATRGAPWFLLATR